MSESDSTPIGQAEPEEHPSPPSIEQEPGRCTIGLLTWNAGPTGEICVLPSLRQTERVEIIWVDNASTDDTPKRLRERCPKLPEPIINPRNLGFCAGHNQVLGLCRTPYYLALNQDAVIASDYVQKLCDWMDERPSLALASGLIRRANLDRGSEITRDPTRDDSLQLYSAGLVFPRVRFPFELGMGRDPTRDPVPEEYAGRRIVPGVTGAAMMLRVDACRAASLPETDADEPTIFCPSFFAYHEEVDLAMRLARAGYECGVEGTACAIHGGQGSGGLRRRAIRARLFANHWLLTLRHDPWGLILREAPYILRGELQYWLPRYLRHPPAFLEALLILLRESPAARRFNRRFEARHGPSMKALGEYRDTSLRMLRESRGQQVQ